MNTYNQITQRKIIKYKYFIKINKNKIILTHSGEELNVMSAF